MTFQSAGPHRDVELHSLNEFIKELSFDNPNAPRSLGPRHGGTNATIDVKVDVQQLAAEDYEILLTIRGSATEGEEALFRFSLTYGGVFRLRNISEEVREPLTLIECPKLLFPFARQIIADVVRNGGFAPLLLDPIDFHGLYAKRRH